MGCFIVEKVRREKTLPEEVAGDEVMRWQVAAVAGGGRIMCCVQSTYSSPHTTHKHANTHTHRTYHTYYTQYT